MLKKFIPQKPMSSIGEGSLSAGTEENRLAQREEPRTTPSTIDPKKYMAEHSGKDILSSDVEIKGSIKFQKELLIDGKVEGEINSDGVLTIGENADIRGEIKTKSITVYGKVQGNITVGERCELKSRCTLQGDLKAARLVIEEGATFIGKSEVTSGTSSKAATPASEARRSCGTKSRRRRLPRRLSAPASKQPTFREPRPVAKPSPAKVSVDCPHCGFKQMEYAAAKSTMCRQCGAHFVPSAPEAGSAASPEGRTASSAAPIPRFSENRRLLDQAPQLDHRVFRLQGHAGSQFRRDLDDLPEVQRAHRPARLQDHHSFSRSIRTHGEVHLTAKGDLSSSSVTCRSALIEGKLRGNLQCLGHGHDQFRRQDSRAA